MDKKKIIFIAGIVLIVILGIVAINIAKKNNKNEVIDKLNESILKDTTVEGLKITNQSVITRDGLSTYMANITNETSETKHIDYLYIIFTLNNEEINALALRNVDIGPDSKTPIVINYDRDISKATKINYEITKDKK